MSGRQPQSRERIIMGAADLIRRRGLAGSTVRDLAAHSGAPLGSTYHYFPRGKQQLAAEAVRFAGELVTRSLERELEAGPVAGLRAFLALWRQIVIDSDFSAGCPVLAVAVEEPPADTDPEAVHAAAEVFTTWEDLLAASLRDHGAPAGDAAQLATLIVAAVEGTVALCRAKRGIEPLDAVATQLETLVTTAIGR
ncbi:TetR/AcrR family transcriptional regulator [Microtetraspora sp. AC03309]|uniref:TetR/AcrR family transcriptional regulator n=1 Tax=Microtetraspora sp. AC03309 TaxID=2779376 RepID=UPI001E570678|nr:TetR/AcrR family transcriptional regulator [Microtetraspora sp. AC03309]MCC5574169.1 TetR/AcrR family transcriptional regulator [Microtetraspora sp. AC03309]